MLLFVDFFFNDCFVNSCFEMFVELAEIAARKEAKSTESSTLLADFTFAESGRHGASCKYSCTR